MGYSCASAGLRLRLLVLTGLAGAAVTWAVTAAGLDKLLIVGFLHGLALE